MVKISFGGMDAPDNKKEMTVTFAGNKLTPSEDGKAEETRTFKVDAKEEPAHIDLDALTGKEALAGIYKFDKDGQLTLVFDLDGRPKGFDDKKAATMTMLLEKVKK